MRIFIAINLPLQVREQIGLIKGALPFSSADIKWVEPDNYHLTLKFLGEVAPENIGAIKSRLSALSATINPITLGFDNLGFFPNSRNPRVIWLGVKGETQKVIQLAGKIDGALADLGYRREDNFRIHLTLGRVRRGARIDGSRLINTNYLSDDIRSLKLLVTDFYLMQSILSNQGPQYRVLGKFKL